MPVRILPCDATNRWCIPKKDNQMFAQLSILNFLNHKWGDDFLKCNVILIHLAMWYRENSICFGVRTSRSTPQFSNLLSWGCDLCLLHNFSLSPIFPSSRWMNAGSIITHKVCLEFTWGEGISPYFFLI